MNRWLHRANKRISLSSAAALLVGASLIGQVLGFMRTQVINANFPAFGPGSTDAYFAAFKIPDLFFYTIAAGALGVAFMPFLADRLEKGDKKTVWQLTSSLLNLLGILMVAVALVLIIFAEPLIKLIINKDLNPQQLHNAATIMRLIAFNPLLFTISGILVSVQQTFGRFFFFAIGPLVYNLCIIASIYIFRDNIGLIGLGIGAMVGAVLQLVIVSFGLFGLNFKYFPTINWHSLDFRRILRQLPARSIDQGIDSINSIVETNRAGHLGTGNISFYENAYILHTAPIMLVGNSIATAAFPRLTRRLSQGRPDLFRHDFLQIIRAMIWIIMPIVVVSFFARAYLARMIFKANAPEIASIFGFLAGAILFRTLYAIISRYFYAHKDTRTPLYVSLFAIALNVFLVFNWARPRPEGYDIDGLALAQSLVAAAEVFILVVIIIKRDPKLFNLDFWNGIVKIISVTGFTILTAFIMVSLVPLNAADKGFTTLAPKLFFIVTPTLLVHLGLSSLFGLEESIPVVDKIRKLIYRPVKIQ
jgi:putative peptidoglycan lipid II flippase